MTTSHSDTMLSADDEYRTDNISLVAYLKMCDFEPVRIEWVSRGKGCFWYFENRPEIGDTIKEFYDDEESCVSPIAFSRMHARVKEEMFEAKRKQQKR